MAGGDGPQHPLVVNLDTGKIIYEAIENQMRQCSFMTNGHLFNKLKRFKQTVLLWPDLGEKTITEQQTGQFVIS